LHGLDLGAQTFDGVAVHSGQQSAFAPLFFGNARPLHGDCAESAPHGKAFGLERGQRDVDPRCGQRQ
jgi:hypothetical protein